MRPRLFGAICLKCATYLDPSVAKKDLMCLKSQIPKRLLEGADDAASFVLLPEGTSSGHLHHGPACILMLAEPEGRRTRNIFPYDSDCSRRRSRAA